MEASRIHSQNKAQEYVEGSRHGNNNILKEVKEMVTAKELVKWLSEMPLDAQVHGRAFQNFSGSYMGLEGNTGYKTVTITIECLKSNKV